MKKRNFIKAHNFLYNTQSCLTMGLRDTNETYPFYPCKRSGLNQPKASSINPAIVFKNDSISENPYRPDSRKELK